MLRPVHILLAVGRRCCNFKKIFAAMFLFLNTAQGGRSIGGGNPLFHRKGKGGYLSYF